jgi:hypothetical protein
MEFDGDSAHVDGCATHRMPSHNSSLPVDISGYDTRIDNAFTIITTNHYLLCNSVGYDYSAFRYNEIKQTCFDQAASGINEVEARLSLEKAGHEKTLQQILFYPDLLKVDVYFDHAGGDGAFLEEKLHLCFSEDSQDSECIILFFLIMVFDH